MTGKEFYGFFKKEKFKEKLILCFLSSMFFVGIFFQVYLDSSSSYYNRQYQSTNKEYLKINVQVENYENEINNELNLKENSEFLQTKGLVYNPNCK